MTAGKQSIKCNTGDAVIYSSSSLHKVNEVTSGVRLVEVTWAQSMERKVLNVMLCELSLDRESLMGDSDDVLDADAEFNDDDVLNTSINIDQNTQGNTDLEHKTNDDVASENQLKAKKHVSNVYANLLRHWSEL